MVQWLMTHSTFLSNPLYIAGDSYTGMIAPIIVQEIWNGSLFRSFLFSVF